jgi:hypothetical protein
VSLFGDIINHRNTGDETMTNQPTIAERTAAFPDQWQVTTRWPDGSVRDVAVFHNEQDAEARVAFYAATEGLTSTITVPAEMRREFQAMLEAEVAGKMTWGRAPFSGREWDDAWANGPGSTP